MCVLPWILADFSNVLPWILAKFHVFLPWNLANFVPLRTDNSINKYNHGLFQKKY
jgi:hypothetical protein